MADFITYPAVVGEQLHGYLESLAGQEIEMVTIVIPVLPNGQPGQPTFLSTLHPDIMQSTIIQIAGSLAMGVKRAIIDDTHKDH